MLAVAHHWVSASSCIVVGEEPFLSSANKKKTSSRDADRDPDTSLVQGTDSVPDERRCKSFSGRWHGSDSDTAKPHQYERPHHGTSAQADASSRAAVSPRRLLRWLLCRDGGECLAKG